MQEQKGDAFIFQVIAGILSPLFLPSYNNKLVSNTYLFFSVLRKERVGFIIG